MTAFSNLTPVTDASSRLQPPSPSPSAYLHRLTLGQPLPASFVCPAILVTGEPDLRHTHTRPLPLSAIEIPLCLPPPLYNLCYKETPDPTPLISLKPYTGFEPTRPVEPT